MTDALAEFARHVMKRRHAPGTAPGTLPARVEPAVPTRARILAYGLEQLEEVELVSTDSLDRAPAAATRWLDVEGHDVRVIAELGHHLGIHPLALEDVVHIGQRPKFEEFEGCLFVVLDHFSYQPESGELAKEQVSLVLQPGLVLSVRERPSRLFDPVRHRLEEGAARIRGGGAGYLAYTLVDSVVDHLFPVLEALGDRIEEVEAGLLDGPDPGDLAALHLVRRDLLLLRKSLWPLRDMLNGLLRADTPLITRETLPYLRDVSDHATTAVDIVETLREMVSSLLDLYMSSVSNRMNEIMKVLTIIATIFIPLGFIAGVYGMNFNREASPLNMPELDWYLGYPFALLMMATVAGGLLLFFRRRGWI